MSEQQPVSVKDIVYNIEQRFAAADLFYGHGTSNPLDEAVYLVFTVLNLAFDCAEDELEAMVDSPQQAIIERYCQQRIHTKKPMAYIVNQAWFCGLPFYVNEDVLIPRSPMAELIEDRFQPWVDEKQIKHILDIGTGSACIAIACAYAFPEANVDACDISDDAIKVAEKNIVDHELSDRMRAIQSDLYADLDGRQYDLIISNPPYVSDAEVAELPDEYRHEPVDALRADDNGLSLVKQIIKQASQHLTEHGLLIVEVGYSQPALIDALPKAPFFWFEFANGGDGVFMLTKEQLQAMDV